MSNQSKRETDSNEKSSPIYYGNFDIDALLQRVLCVGLHGQSLTTNIGEDDIVLLCAHARQLFLKQPVLLEVEAPVTVCGDTHGQYADLLRLFNIGGFPPDTNYVFLGDYVDRGKQSLETILLLFCYKIKFPNNLFLLRGNHECWAINQVYGFYEECTRRYNARVWSTFQEVFDCMPFVCIIGGRIMCMHGGISNPCPTNTNDRPLVRKDQLKSIRRPTDPPQNSFMMDLLWADPEQHVCKFRPNTRGISVVFGVDAVHEFCERFGLDLICRGHQVVQDGYEFFARRRLVTIFSAPHYCGEFDNAAGMMTVSPQLTCAFKIVKASHKKTVEVRAQLQSAVNRQNEARPN